MSNTNNMKTLLEMMDPESSRYSESTLREDDDGLVEELENIRSEIEGLVREAIDIVEASGNSGAIQRARSYWYPHILQALGAESEYMGGSMHSMADTVEELENDGVDDEY